MNTYAVDLAIAGLVQLAVSAPFVLTEAGNTQETTWRAYLLATGTVVPLIWRRREPLVCALVIVVATIAHAIHGPDQPLAYGFLVATYTLFALAPRGQRIFFFAGSMVGIPFSAYLADGSVLDYGFVFLTFFGACLLGALTRTQQAYAAALQERAHRAELEREAEAARAVTRERARISRDMHDVLAHAVSLMVIQAEAAAGANTGQVAKTFDAIADAGRDAMNQLRRILGVLSEDDPASRVPQPTIAAIPELVSTVDKTGLPTALEVVGDERQLSPDVHVAVYRIVQEGLTNAVKHSGASRVVVRLEWGATDLTVTVTDDGRGVGSGSGGYGLIGIRERAAASGGTAQAGPGPGGGFRVTARFPVKSTVESS